MSSKNIIKFYNSDEECTVDTDSVATPTINKINSTHFFDNTLVKDKGNVCKQHWEETLREESLSDPSNAYLKVKFNTVRGANSSIDLKFGQTLVIENMVPLGKQSKRKMSTSSPQKLQFKAKHLSLHEIRKMDSSKIMSEILK